MRYLNQFVVSNLIIGPEQLTTFIRYTSIINFSIVTDALLFVANTIMESYEEHK